MEPLLETNLAPSESLPLGVGPQSGLSHVRGDGAMPLSGLTIQALLAETIAHFPDRLAGVFREQGLRWTWREFGQCRAEWLPHRCRATFDSLPRCR